MEIQFCTDKLARLCNSEAALNKTYGPACAKRIRLRLQQLEAVASLADMVFSAQCELKGDRVGQLSIDLTPHSRLIVQPLPDSATTTPDTAAHGITAKHILIVDIVDASE